MIEAAAGCFDGRPYLRERLGERRALEAIARLEQLVKTNAGGFQTLGAMCAAMDIPVRTLNTACRAVLGMGAGRYLRQRRLHEVRRALLQGEASVTQAAMAQGFWELGRFSAEYRAAFAEYPSETVQRRTA